MKLWVERFDSSGIKALAKLVDAGFMVDIRVEDESIVVDIDMVENRVKSLYTGNSTFTKFALDDQ